MNQRLFNGKTINKLTNEEVVELYKEWKYRLKEIDDTFYVIKKEFEWRNGTTSILDGQTKLEYIEDIPFSDIEEE